MTDLKLVQYSPEFFANRRGTRHVRINGSECSVACNCDPYALPSSLYSWLLLVEENPQIEASRVDCDHDEFTRPELKNGHIGENFAVKLYVKLTGYTVEHGSYWVHAQDPDFYGASPDGLVYENGKMVGLLECKFCSREMVNRIDISHFFQMQYQLFVVNSGKEKVGWVDYMRIKMNSDCSQVTEFYYRRVYPSLPFISWMKNRVDRFIHAVSNKNLADYKLVRLIDDTKKNKEPIENSPLIRMIEKIQVTDPLSDDCEKL